MNPETEAHLRALIDEVLRVNRQFNLTAVRDPDDAWQKHVLDALQGLETGLFEDEKSVADLGTGAGFPGLPLAITRPQLHLTLVEATRKKCDFLRSAIEKFTLNAEVLCARAEALGQSRAWRESFDVVTARAVGSISEVCELALPLARVDGHVVLWRGQWAPEEIAAARDVLTMLGGACRELRPYQLPGHEMTYHLVVLDKIAPTPAKFPRREGLPKHQPLCAFDPPQKTL